MVILFSPHDAHPAWDELLLLSPGEKIGAQLSHQSLRDRPTGKLAYCPGSPKTSDIARPVSQKPPPKSANWDEWPPYPRAPMWVHRTSKPCAQKKNLRSWYLGNATSSKTCRGPILVARTLVLGDGGQGLTPNVCPRVRLLNLWHKWAGESGDHRKSPAALSSAALFLSAPYRPA